MSRKNRGQISVEYLIVVGFVIFVVISLLGVSFFYISQIRDQIKINQLESFANKVISNAETVFFAGDPSKATINAHLPAGVTSFTIEDINGEPKLLVFTIQTDSGTNVIGYTSTVPISGTLSINDGLKRITITATSTGVTIQDDA